LLCSRKASARARNVAGLTRRASNVRSRQMMTSLLILRRCSAALCLIRSYNSSGMLLTVMLGMATPPRPIMEPFWNHRNGPRVFLSSADAHTWKWAQRSGCVAGTQEFRQASRQLQPVVRGKRVHIIDHFSNKSFKARRSCSTNFMSSAYFSSDMSGDRNKVRITSLPVPFDRTRIGT